MATTERLYRLVVDANQATRELQKLNTSVSGIDQKFGALGSSFKSFGVALAASFSVDAVIGGLKRVIDSVDQMADKAESLGLLTSKLQEFNYAAQQSGSSAEGIEKGLTFLSRSIAENDKAFAAMGVSIKQSNGELKSTDQVLLAVADKFSGYRDGAEKVALATALFGKEGAKLIPFLNQGAEGLTKLGEEAKTAGAIVGEDAVKSIKDFNDNLDALGSRTQAFIANALGPLLKWLNDAITHFKAASDAAGGFFGALALNAETNVKRAFGGDAATLTKQYAAELNSLRAVEDQRVKNGEKQSASNQARIKELQFLIQLEGKRAAQQSGQKFEPDAPPTTTTKPAAPIVPTGGGGGSSRSIKKVIEETEAFRAAIARITDEESRAALNDWAQSLRFAVDAVDFKAQAAEVEEFEKQIKEMNDRVEQTTDAFRAQARALIEANDPAARYETAFKKLEDLKPYLPLELFAKLVAKLDAEAAGWFAPIKKELSFMESASDVMMKSFDSFFANMERGTAGAKEAFERMAQSMLLQLARLAASKLFDQFFGKNTSWGLSNPFASGSGAGGVTAPRPLGMDIVPRNLSIRSIPSTSVMKAGSDPQQFVSGSAAPQVTVINNAGAEIGVESRQNADGTASIDILVERKVKGMIASGAMDRVMASTFGARRRGFA